MDNAMKTALSKITFALMHNWMNVYEALNIPVISTTRPLNFYRRILFDNIDNEELAAKLNGNTLVDIGCGLTPFIEDSMFQWCRRNGIAFYAVDPKVKDGFKFGIFDRLKSYATGARTPPNPNIEGLDKTIAAFANDLPFENNSVDIILSCWLVFSWLRSDEILADAFKEFNRILKPGGSIRMYPTHQWDEIVKRYPLLSAQLNSFHIEQRFFVSPDIGSVPPAYMTRFTKKD